MAAIGQTFTAGEWRVKEGQEDHFVRAWAGFASWSFRNGWGAEAPHLLQSTENPRRFLSFGAWDSPEQVRSWRELPEFKQFFVRMQELCEDIHPEVLRLVASPGA